MLAQGAPQDEFDNESKKISSKINCESSSQEIVNIITDVFNSSFGTQNENKDFLLVAERMKQELMHF